MELFEFLNEEDKKRLRISKPDCETECLEEVDIYMDVTDMMGLIPDFVEKIEIILGEECHVENGQFSEYTKESLKMELEDIHTFDEDYKKGELFFDDRSAAITCKGGSKLTVWSEYWGGIKFSSDN